MLKHVECRVIESRPIRIRPTGQVPSRVLPVEKPQPEDGMLKYDFIELKPRFIPAQTDTMYTYTPMGRICPDSKRGQRLDLWA